MQVYKFTIAHEFDYYDKRAKFSDNSCVEISNRVSCLSYIIQQRGIKAANGNTCFFIILLPASFVLYLVFFIAEVQHTLYLLSTRNCHELTRIQTILRHTVDYTCTLASRPVTKFHIMKM